MDIDNKLWQFAVTFYAQPGVALELLALQNDHAVSINQMLLALWLASDNRSLTVLPAVEDEAAQWQQQVTAPLRQIRFWLKRQQGDAQLKLATADCYQQLLKAELATEQVELALLFTHSDGCNTTMQSSVGVRQLAWDNLNFYIESRPQSSLCNQSNAAHRSSLLQGLLNKFCLMLSKAEK